LSFTAGLALVTLAMLGDPVNGEARNPATVDLERQRPNTECLPKRTLGMASMGTVAMNITTQWRVI